MPKLIGLSSLTSETQHRLNTAYVSAFTRKGITPFILPSFSLENWENISWKEFFDIHAESINSIADSLDGLVLTGGVDINPESFDVRNFSSCNCDSMRDFMEMSLFHAFLKRNKPIMGICRGHQIIGNMMGLEKYFQQDLDTSEILEIHTGTNLELKNRQETAHRVYIYNKFREFWSKVSNREVYELQVNSWHHQGFTLTEDGQKPELPKKMTFAQWRSMTIDNIQKDYNVDILACSRMVIEALQYKEAPIFSVQWHPEEYGPNSQTINYWIENFF